MKITRKANRMDRADPRPVLAAAVALGLALLISLSQTQAQQQPKGPRVPSFDEVMQRALREKQNAAKAAATPPQSNPPPVTLTPPTTKSVVPPPTPPFVLPPPTGGQNGKQVAPKAPASPGATTTKKPTSKGPIFSELPPDLRPGAAPVALLPPDSKVTLPGTVTNAMTTLDDQHRLAIGDHLTFRIMEDDEAPKRLVVTPSGEVVLPYLGRFPAAGKTCRALAGEVKVRLEKDYYYRATVVITVDLKSKKGAEDSSRRVR